MAPNQSRFLGRGCDKALFSEKKGVSVKRGEAIQWMRGLVRIFIGKAIQWRGSGHSLNRRTLKTEKLLSSSPSQKSALTKSIQKRGNEFRSNFMLESMLVAYHDHLCGPVKKNEETSLPHLLSLWILAAVLSLHAIKTFQENCWVGELQSHPNLHKQLEHHRGRRRYMHDRYFSSCSWPIHAYHSPNMWTVPAHVRDTCMKHTSKNCMLVTCWIWFWINNVSLTSTTVSRSSFHAQHSSVPIFHSEPQQAPNPPQFAQPRLSRSKWHRSNTPKFVASRRGNTSHTGGNTAKFIPSR